MLTSKVPEQEKRGVPVRLLCKWASVAFWSLLFAPVVGGGILGKFPLDRAIAPAIYLLLFIGFLGWAIGMAERGKA